MHAQEQEQEQQQQQQSSRRSQNTLEHLARS